MLTGQWAHFKIQITIMFYISSSVVIMAKKPKQQQTKNNLCTKYLCTVCFRQQILFRDLFLKAETSFSVCFLWYINITNVTFPCVKLGYAKLKRLHKGQL